MDELAQAKADYLVTVRNLEWRYWDGTGDIYPFVTDMDGFVLYGWDRTNKDPIAVPAPS